MYISNFVCAFSVSPWIKPQVSDASWQLLEALLKCSVSKVAVLFCDLSLPIVYVVRKTISFDCNRSKQQSCFLWFMSDLSLCLWCHWRGEMRAAKARFTKLLQHLLSGLHLCSSKLDIVSFYWDYFLSTAGGACWRGWLIIILLRITAQWYKTVMGV